jgi:phosphatidylserine/phosphatidylglycerophosphate/cardiolipin synthase-like enzyme
VIWNKHALRSKWCVVGVTVGLTVLGVVIARNFVGGEKGVQRRIPHLYSVHDSAFGRAMGLALGPSIVGGNRVVALFNGDEIFPAMLQAIRGAQTTITLETYIYWGGEIGRQFAVALSERSRAGVKVHVLIDWVGSSKMDESYVAMMEQAGIEFREYRPLRWYNLGRLNKRTHRKLLVVDGRIGFTGGVGIAEMCAAERSIYLSSAYFIPDPLTQDALTNALKRGVKVQIITPGKHMDRKIVRGASRSRWGELLAAGAEMYEYEPTMYHCKVFIVDELLVSVGSTNWDPRSFGLNDEANLNIYDADFARRQVDVFRQDLTKSRRVTLAQWRARPFREKLMERLESLLGSVL